MYNWFKDSSHVPSIFLDLIIVILNEYYVTYSFQLDSAAESIMKEKQRWISFLIGYGVGIYL